MKTSALSSKSGLCRTSHGRIGPNDVEEGCVGTCADTIAEKQGELDCFLRGVLTSQSKIEPIKLDRNIDRLREADDLYRFQRVRLEWRVNGDKNTAFFHAVAIQRSKSNIITALQGANGVLTFTLSTIHNIAIEFYKQLFSSQSDGRIDITQLSTGGRLNASQVGVLDMRFTLVEVKRCLFSTKGNKASGPDGIPVLFYQHYWDTVGSDQSIGAWWGSKENKRTIHGAAWATLCKEKADGRLGFRDSYDFNLALLCKYASRPGDWSLNWITLLPESFKPATTLMLLFGQCLWDQSQDLLGEVSSLPETC
ncbi:hypothetical protein LIER_15652 [Lithospermum erythrorhizon]|uniref:Uncharacterized protein n=1 Tax=Lithospermum erythrorhizon TaxID=34254 RepID=A0AAV3Q912_LITER